MAKERQTEEKFKTMIGGQALIEGIMMRGPKLDAIVTRGKDGLTVETKPTHSVGCVWLLRNRLKTFKIYPQCSD